MKKYFLFLSLVLLLIQTWSCITFKADYLPPPDNRVEGIHLCRGIDDRDELLNPLDIQSEFTSKDEHIICFIRLKNIATKLNLRWKWYSPDKKMVRDTGKVVVNPVERYLEAVTAYDRYKPNSDENVDGQWTVVVFMNDKFVGRKTFLYLN
jgi:hypothetical protein